jgi:AcrR family transcriptional regulator
VTDERTLRGRELWLTAGQELLRAGGVRTIKVRSLADQLGLTTGSFYHHFSGMQDYLDGLAAHFADVDAAALASIAADDPRARLQAIAEAGADRRRRSLDVAMRDWGMTNEAAAASVRAHDAMVLEFLEVAFSALGHPVDEARLRAHVLHAATVAQLASPWPDDARLVERMVDVLAA